MNRKRAAVHVQRWLDGERRYAEAKWDPDQTAAMLTEQELHDWVNQYVHRAFVLGLDTQLGRQALAKSLRTLLAFVEATVVTHGCLPLPGRPSGEIK